jgi:uncharacterized membrane protein YqjE
MGAADPPQPGESPLRDAVSRLGDALLGLTRTRLELVSIEYAEERSRIVRQLAYLVAGLGCLLIALLFGAAGVVMFFWDTHPFAAVVGVVVVFAGTGVVMLWRRAEISHTAPTPFAASLAELEKDRSALGRHPPGAR